MICETRGIRLHSEMNPEIDFILIPSDESLISEVKSIAIKAFDDWWADDPCEPICEYVVHTLAEHGYEVDLFVNLP